MISKKADIVIMKIATCVSLSRLITLIVRGLVCAGSCCHGSFVKKAQMVILSNRLKGLID